MVAADTNPVSVGTDHVIDGARIFQLITALYVIVAVAAGSTVSLIEAMFPIFGIAVATELALKSLKKRLQQWAVLTTAITATVITAAIM